MPALLKSRCRWSVSCCSPVWSRKARVSFSWATSATKVVIFTPWTAVFSAMRTVSSISASRMSHMATLQPSEVRACTRARPMPLPPPVTTAILPLKSFMPVLLWIPVCAGPC